MSQIDVANVNAFIRAGLHVLEELVGGEIVRGQLTVRSALYTSQPVTIVVGVAGDVRGHVAYGMTQVTATKIAAAMQDTPHVAFDEVTLSAVSELGNIISGNAMAYLSETIANCDLTPPAIVRGLQVEVAANAPTLVVPFDTRCGRIEISLALTDLTVTAARREETYAATG
jgi:chemotaxis protein CheX